MSKPFMTISGEELKQVKLKSDNATFKYFHFHRGMFSVERRYHEHALDDISQVGFILISKNKKGFWTCNTVVTKDELHKYNLLQTMIIGQAQELLK